MKKMSLVMAFLLALIVNHAAYAGGWINPRQIEAITYMQEGVLIHAIGGWNNVNSCGNSDAIVLLSGDVNFDNAQALVLTAFAAGTDLQGYSDNCATVDGTTYNAVRGFKYLRATR